MKPFIAIFTLAFAITGFGQRIDPTTRVDEYGIVGLLAPVTNNVWLAKSKPNKKPNIEKKVKAHGPKNKSKHFTYLDIVRLEIDSPELVNELREDVEYIVPDTLATISAIPTDPMWAQQWDMVNIGMPATWDKSTGTDTVVAIFDTGADYTHPDLIDNLIGGWQCFSGVVTNGGMDDHGHGTHVAGAIGAVANNSVGIAGMNWRVKLMPMKFMDRSGSGWTSDCIALLDRAIELKAHGMNIRVGNNSWGGGGAEIALQDAYQRFEEAGILSVCAAGNSGLDIDINPIEPGGLPNRGIIAVLANDSQNKLASFSNYGFLGADVAAPGVSTLSAVPTNTTFGMGNATGYRTASGTSMACPHVAGLAALALSVNPNLSVYELKDLLLNQQSTDPMSEMGTLSTTGAKINAAKTVNNPMVLNPKTNSIPVVSEVKAFDTSGGKPSFMSFQASDPDGDPLRVVTIDRWNRNVVATNLFWFTPESRFLDVTIPFFVGASDSNGGSAGSNLFVNIYHDPETFRLQDYKVSVTASNPPGLPQIYTRTWLTTNSEPGREVFFKPYITGKGFNGWNANWLPIGSGFSMRYSGFVDTNASYMVKSYTDNYQLAPHPESERIILRLGTDATNTMPFPMLRVVMDKLSGQQPLTIGFSITNLSNPKTNNTFWVMGQAGGCANCNWSKAEGAFYNGTITLTDVGIQSISFLVMDKEHANNWDVQEWKVSVLAKSNSIPVPPPIYLSAPTGLTVTAETSGMFLNWIDNSTGEDRYEIETTEKKKGPWPQFRNLATLPPDTHGYAYSDVIKNYNYQFRVRAAVGTNFSDYSNVATIRFK